LTLRYDGTDFAGSQVQPGARTVQGELERSLLRLGGATRTTFAGRTDRGVHAYGQVVAAQLAHWSGPAEELARSVNSLLPRDISIVAASVCADGFNPRFAAEWREYRYRLLPGITSPFVDRYAWTPRFSLDLNAMVDAARRLEGRNDFATFASGGEGVPWSERASRPRGTTRTLYRCDCDVARAVDGPLAGSTVSGIEIRVVADGFLPQMVRNITGALVEVGRGSRDPAWIDELIAARDRRFGPEAAPARGLTLWRVGFSDTAVSIVDAKRREVRAGNRGAK
jgi:tRNA pseudouridine38-40 synthase